MTNFHRRFAGSVRWRVTKDGIEVEGSGLIPVSAARAQRCGEFLGCWRSEFAAAATTWNVPVELLLATALTESALVNPLKSVRIEPGWMSDESTPHRVSIGLCQMLISTARSTMNNPAIDRAWLFVPANAINSCAAYIRSQFDVTQFDPILVCCAYNAGGIYEQRGAENRWRLRQFPIGTGKHADRFAEHFNAAMALMKSLEDAPVCPSIFDILKLENP